MFKALSSPLLHMGDVCPGQLSPARFDEGVILAGSPFLPGLQQQEGSLSSHQS